MVSRRLILSSVAGVLVLAVGGFAVWLATLPAGQARANPPALEEGEMAATVAALAPPKRRRPVIAIVGVNDATEVTDYLMPAGILRRADVADVLLLSTDLGPVKLYPALTVQADSTTAAFDDRYPEGADYVIVPAMSREDDPAVLAWIRDQARKGAVIIGVCVGAKVVGAAGLLENKRATTHWFSLKALRKRTPSMDYVPDRRMVVDGKVATTTGITASMPTMLTLIEAIAGRPRAEAVARDLGVVSWDARHDSSAFKFSRPFATTVLGNVLTPWRREDIGIGVRPGVDEVSLALVADAWSRTYRSKAVTYGSSGVIETRHGVRLIPDKVMDARSVARRVKASADRKPAQALDEVLGAIAGRYGDRTADVVAMQLEYAR